jgi:hypothetical protein
LISTKNEVEKIGSKSSNPEDDDSKKQTTPTNVENKDNSDGRSEEKEDSNSQNESTESSFGRATGRVTQNDASVYPARKNKMSESPANVNNQESTSSSFLALGPAKSILPESTSAPTVSVSAVSVTPEGSTRVAGINLVITTAAPLAKKSTHSGNMTVTGSAINMTGTKAMADWATNAVGTPKVSKDATNDFTGTTKWAGVAVNVSLTTTLVGSSTPTAGSMSARGTAAAEGTTSAAGSTSARGTSSAGGTASVGSTTSAASVTTDGRSSLAGNASQVNGTTTALGSSFLGQTKTSTTSQTSTTTSIPVQHTFLLVLPT